MPKTRQQKQATVASLAENFKKGKAVVFANFQGLTVAEMEELRRNCRQEGIEVLAAKKTLVKRACGEAGFADIDPKAFSGGVATFIGARDEVAPAKVTCNFAKTHEVMAIFGGILEGRFVNIDVVKSLAALPGKQELLAKLVGSINAPVSGFVNVLAGNLRNLVGVLNNIKNAKA